MTDTNQGGDPSKKTYHKKATGLALTTVKSHSKEDDLKLYGSAFWYAPPHS
jgi:glutathione S-transferase